MASKEGILVFLGKDVLEGEQIGVDSLNVKGFVPKIVKWLLDNVNAASSSSSSSSSVASLEERLLMAQGDMSERELVQFIMDEIKSTCRWQARDNKAMFLRGHEIKRKKAFLVAREEGDDTPASEDPLNYRRYYYTGLEKNKPRDDFRTGFQNETLLMQRYLDSSPFLNALNLCMKKHLRYVLGPEADASTEKLYEQSKSIELNQVIATLYETETDNIGAHNDKTRDIRKNSLIMDISYGGDREFHLTNAEGKLEKIIVLQAGDLFILGPGTNGQWKHAVVPVSEEQVIDRKQTIFSTRMSTVHRNIKTLFSKKNVLKMVNSSRKQAEKRKDNKEQRKRKLALEEEETGESNKKRKQSETDSE